MFSVEKRIDFALSTRYYIHFSLPWEYLPEGWTRRRSRPHVGGDVKQPLGKSLWILFTVGWYVALSLLLPTGIGYWLDNYITHTAPILTLVGFGLGTLLAFGGLYRILMRFAAENKVQEPTKKENSSKGDKGAT